MKSSPKTSPRWLFPLLLIMLIWSGLVSAQEPTLDKDQASTAQLREAFRQVEGLEQVTLEVRGGVAVLRGPVPSLEVSMKAERLAEKLDDILTVDNGLTVETDIAKRVSPALTKLYDTLKNILVYAPLLILAIVIFMIFLTLGSALTRWNWLYQKLSANLFVQDLVKQIVYFATLVAGALVALELLDATALVGALLGTAGVFGVAMGFAFRDLAENSLASILLSLRQPFAPNDHVVVDGQEGKVVRLTSRATILLTLDGNHLRIPNSTVFKASILNYTKNPERRFSFSVGIDTEENIPRVQTLALDILHASPGITSSPPPHCLVEALGDSNVSLRIIGWVDQTKNDYLKVKSDAIRRIKEAFDEADIFMPEPIYKIKMEQTEPRKVKVEEVREPEELPADLAPETHLEERIVEERESVADDLLTEEAVLE